MVKDSKLLAEFHRVNSGKETIESYGATLTKLHAHFAKDRALAAITCEGILALTNTVF